ncbi:hypothetical protein C8T65DRAFT_747190 [Cerioporus squamosus]|nr:hypothetical protein C8T65DRAFT_747190 [Cerioporus squamosus]
MPAPADIVGQTINRHLPPRQELNIPVCGSGGRHGVQASYGKSTLGNLGIIFGWCDKQCSAFHKKIIKKQMSVEQRYRCMRSLHAITSLPPAYDMQQFNKFCETEAQKAREMLHNQRQLIQPPHTLLATPPSSLAASTSLRTTTRSSRTIVRATTSKCSVGRPRLQHTQVLVVLFAENHAPAISIQAKGIVNGPLVSFQSGQGAIKDTLDRAFGAGHRPLLDMWNPTCRSWEPAPKSSNVQTLLRGKGRLYKPRKVHFLCDFDRHKARILPEIERAIARSVHPATSPPPSSSPAPSSPMVRSRLAPFPMPPPSPRLVAQSAPKIVAGPSSTEVVGESSHTLVACKRANPSPSSIANKRRAVKAAGSEKRPILVVDSDDDVIELSDAEEDNFWGGMPASTGSTRSQDTTTVVRLQPQTKKKRGGRHKGQQPPPSPGVSDDAEPDLCSDTPPPRKKRKARGKGKAKAIEMLEEEQVPEGYTGKLRDTRIHWKKAHLEYMESVYSEYRALKGGAATAFSNKVANTMYHNFDWKQMKYDDLERYRIGFVTVC